MKKSVVYLFGAGASKDFGFPLGLEIFEYAQRLSRLDCTFALQLRGALAEVERHMKYVFAKLPRSKASYPPFEEVLTFVWDCKKAERWDYDRRKLISPFKSKDGAADVVQALVKTLVLTLACSTEVHHRERIQLFQRFVQSLLMSGEKIAFISLNYDLVLDNILCDCVTQKIIKDFCYGVPLYDVSLPFDRLNPFKNPCFRKEGVFLLKPHGSLNLVTCPHHQAHYGDGYFFSKDDLIATKCDKVRCPACGSAPKPLIIPPLYNKGEFIQSTAVKRTQFNVRATPVWYRRFVDAKIRDALAAADEIVVIGYSMPAYDYDFKTLLMASLMQNRRRRKLRLRIITKGNKSQVDNLKAQFEPFVGNVVVDGSDGFYNYMKAQKWD